MYAPQFFSTLTKTTKSIAMACKQCHADSGGFELCGNQMEVLLTTSGALKSEAHAIATEAARLASNALSDGRLSHWHIATAARLAAHVWLDVSALGTDDLCPAVKSLEEAREHLAEGLAGIKDENLAWQMLR